MQTTMASGTSFVIAAYVLTWLTLAAYGHYVHRRFVRAERELGTEGKESAR